MNEPSPGARVGVLTEPVAGRPHAPAPGRSTPIGPIPALLDLLAEADDLGIRWCSWKSNEHLAAALAGTTDVDLLVDRRDADAFRALMARHGVKPLDPSPGGAHPGIEHHLGMDRGTGRLFHLHVHHRLVLGVHNVKNHRLPMERAFLDVTHRVDGVAVPRPEVELVVLSFRALLKYRARDVVKDVLDIRSIGVPEELRTEIDWLLERADPATAGRAVREAGIGVPEELVVDFLRLMQEQPRSGWALLALRTRLRRALRDHRRRSPAGVLAESLRVAWVRRSRLRTGPARRRMTPTSGGLTVAVVGADGAGKSTVTVEVARWLGWKLDVRVLHLGSNDPSRTTRGLYLLFRATRRAHRAWTVAPAADLRDTVYALHCLGVARDRLRTLRAGRAAAQQGCVVVFDRFPLTPLTGEEGHRVLDGPRISTDQAARGRVRAALARRERRHYAHVTVPDLLVVLQVEPEVAIGRKPDHDPAAITAKARAAADLDGPAARGLPVVSLRAEQPLETILLTVQRELWDAL